MEQNNVMKIIKIKWSKKVYKIGKVKNKICTKIHKNYQHEVLWNKNKLN